MKKILCVLLAVLCLLVPLFSSCGEKKTETAETKASVVTDDVDEDDYTKRSPVSAVDYGKETVKVMQRADCYRQEWNPDYESTDVLYDALLERTIYLEDKYNVVFEYYDYALTDARDAKQNMEAQTGTYDFMSFSPMFVDGFVRSGLIRRTDAIPNINLDADYWYDELNNSLSIGGKSYMIFGTTNLSALNVAYAVFFNKRIMNEFYGETVNIYDLVRSKEWTLDKFIELSTGIYDDTDGEAGVTLKDRYGVIYAGGSWYSLFYGSGLTWVNRNENDEFVYTPDNPTAISLIQKIATAIGDRSITKEFIASDDDDEWDDFTAGNSLFIPESIFMAKTCKKNMTDDYGIVPAPLATEGQENYYSEIHPNHSSALAVPSDVSSDRFDMIGRILEDASFVANEIQIPAFYNTVLKGRMTKDEDSVEMLDYVYSNLVLDPALVYADNIDLTIRSLVEGGSSAAVVSTMSGIQGAADGKLTQVNEALRKMLE